MRSVTVSVNLLVSAPPSVSDDILADYILDMMTHTTDIECWIEGIEIFVDDIEDVE